MKKSIYHFIARHRRNFLLKFFNKLTSSFRNAYNNKDYNHESNGELWLQIKMSSLGLKTVFDVGANIGSWAENARKYFPGATIYCFEPIGPVYEKLKARISHQPQIILVNSALAEATGEAMFNYYPQVDVLSSRFHVAEGGAAVSVPVKMQTGENFCAEHEIRFIDFLKIDTEGSDYAVIQGFDQMISAQKIRAIQFEYGGISVITKFLLKDFYDYFSGKNYMVGKIYPNYVDFSDYTYLKEDFIGLNFLAVHRDDQELIRMLR